MIEVKNLKKNFGTLEVLKDITETIHDGEVICVIGPSGSGKSTFLRCLNMLEEHTGGEVIIDGEVLSSKNVNEIRKQMGMVFQSFNLFPHMTVLKNITVAPIKVSGISEQEARKTAMQLLKRVGLEEKAEAYPEELSGGQKQRVAIARAIANNPKILLCDEATSALDPQTTKSVLELLKQINRDYGITIVVVTHEMSVVQEICNQVAILNEGNVVETGSVSEIFTAPKSPEAKSLIIGSGSTAKEMRGRHCIRIVFKENSSYEPVVGNMTLQFKTPVNILYANTKDLNGTAAGEMILQLPEDTEIAGKMVEYLKEKNLYVGEVEQDVFI